jgi:hypothetical protein
MRLWGRCQYGNRAEEYNSFVRKQKFIMCVGMALDEGILTMCVLEGLFTQDCFKEFLHDDVVCCSQHLNIILFKAAWKLGYPLPNFCETITFRVCGYMYCQGTLSNSLTICSMACAVLAAVMKDLKWTNRWIKVSNPLATPGVQTYPSSTHNQMQLRGIRFC